MSSSRYGSREGSNPFASLPPRPSSSSSRPSLSPSPSPSPLPAQASSSSVAAQPSVRGEFDRGYGYRRFNDDDDPEDGDSEAEALTPMRKHDARLSGASSATAVVTRATSYSRYTWWFEASALVLSAAAIGLTAGFLRWLDGNRIPDWASVGSGLSLNSILSVPSIVARSCLLIPLDEALGQLMWVSFARKGHRLDEVELFHRASRGPAGALRLLGRKNCRGIASLGSLLVVLSVALGFAQQQLISYPSVSLPYPDYENLTHVSTSNMTYNGYQEALPAGNSTATTAGVNNGTTVPIVEFAVSAAVYSSLNHYEQHDPLYRCDSGNCEFPLFATLSVCSYCTNATHDDINHYCDHDSDLCVASYASLSSFAWREADSGTLYSTIINQTADPSAADSIVDTRTLSVNSTHWPPTYTAYACRIFWCVRTVNATVVNATYAETEAAVSTAATLRPDGTAVFAYEMPVAAAAPAAQTQKLEFAVTAKAQAAFKALAPLLTGWSQRSRDDGKWTHSSPFFGGMATFATADMTVGGKHMHRHKPLPVEVIADGMSNAIRNQLTVVGHKVERHTIVKVRWWWLFYSVGVWLLCSIFLAAVVWETRRNEAHFGAWGCSAIALLLWGVDGSVRKQVADWNADGLEAKARAVRVRLEMDGNVWRMRKTDI